MLKSRPKYKNHTLFLTKVAKINTLFTTKTTEKPYPLGPHIPIQPIQEEPPWNLKVLSFSVYLKVFKCNKVKVK